MENRPVSDAIEIADRQSISKSTLVLESLQHILQIGILAITSEMSLEDIGHDQRSLVQERNYLLPIDCHLPGCRWRWYWRFSGSHEAARLPAGPRCYGHLADALPAVPRQGRRLRCCRLLRGESPLRYAGRFRGVYQGLQSTWTARHDRPGGQPHVGPASLVSGSAPRPQVQVSRLVCVVKEETQECRLRDCISRGTEEHVDL